MMGYMRRRLGIFVVLLTVALAPLSALAEDAPKSYDGRLDDFAQPVTAGRIVFESAR